MATVRLSPKPGAELGLLRYLRRTLPPLPALPGIAGAHLLQTQARKPGMPMTAEQRIRGSDATADWVLLLAGYDAAAVADVAAAHLSAAALAAAGAQEDSLSSLYDLRNAMTPADV